MACNSTAYASYRLGGGNACNCIVVQTNGVSYEFGIVLSVEHTTLLCAVDGAVASECKAQRNGQHRVSKDPHAERMCLYW